MDAVIPAAGRGSRLGDLTDDRPKGLVEIAGQPLLAHVFETAVNSGADELIVIVGYEAAQIVDWFGDAFAGVPITYVHQRERLGLGHAVLQAEPHVDGTCLLVNGDNVFTGSVEPAVAAIEEADAALAVEAVSPEVAATTGVVETDTMGRVTGIVEKPAEPSSTLAILAVHSDTRQGVTRGGRHWFQNASMRSSSRVSTVVSTSRQSVESIVSSPDVDASGGGWKCSRVV